MGFENDTEKATTQLATAEVTDLVLPIIEIGSKGEFNIDDIKREIITENSSYAIGELTNLRLFQDVKYEPRMKIISVPEWQKSTGLSDDWVKTNPTRTLMCCRRDEKGFHILAAMKKSGRFRTSELTADDRREWGHEWTHPYQNTQMEQGCGKSLFALKRGFLAEALCELVQRDLVGHGSPVELTNGVVPIREIRKKGFFAIDKNNIGENTAYYSAYLWLRKLLTGEHDQAPTVETVKEFLNFISQFETTNTLDTKIEEKYPGYIQSIS